MIKLVVFDIDGTLIDSDAALARAFQNTFASFKLKTPTEQEALKFAGLPEKKWIASLLKETEQQASEEKLLQMEEYFRQKYFGFYFPVLVHLKAGAREAIEKLRCRGIKIAIATNGSRAYVERVFSFFKLDGLFDAVVSADEVEHAKPSPEPLQHLLKTFHDNAGEVLYLGDTRIDVETAKNARTNFALLVCKRNNRLKAEHRLSSLAELPKLVEELK